LPLTTNLKRKWILITSNDLEEWILYKDSIIIIPKFWVINEDFIDNIIWKLKIETFNKIKLEVCKQIDC
jgi:hypothetical protein